MRNFFTRTDPVVPSLHPRVVVETAVHFGATHEGVLRGSEVQADHLASPDARISYAQFATIAGNAMRLTERASLGLDAGKRVFLPQLGVLGLAAMSAPTLGAAIAVGCRNFATVSPAFRLKLERDAEGAVLSFEPTIRVQYIGFAYDMLLSALVNLTHSFVGRPLRAQYISLPFERPAHWERYPVELGDTEYRFGAERAALCFDPKGLSSALATAEPSTLATTERILREQALHAPSQEGILTRVEDLLRTDAGCRMRITDVAHKLRTSERSLRRALTEAGVSFSDLRDAQRQRRARELMETTSLPPQEIAASLGFRNVNAFRRAFKRWTGKTPQEFRAEP